jgi:hypothetical protein
MLNLSIHVASWSDSDCCDSPGALDFEIELTVPGSEPMVGEVTLAPGYDGSLESFGDCPDQWVHGDLPDRLSQVFEDADTLNQALHEIEAACVEDHKSAMRALRESDEPRSYTLRDDSGSEEDIVASSLKDARKQAEEWVRDGDWRDTDETFWVTVRIWGEDGSQDCIEVAIEPEEPECSADGHAWYSPYAVVGGIRENPGVWGHGGGVIIHEVCSNCGANRHTDTWAQDRNTGQQGLTSVTYAEADEPSKTWVRGLRLDVAAELLEAAGYDVSPRDSDHLVITVDYVEDDDSDLDAIRTALGSGYDADYSGDSVTSGAGDDTCDIHVTVAD